MIKENDSWSLIFNSVQEEDMYEVFWIYSYCAVWNLLHSSGLPSVLYKAIFFLLFSLMKDTTPHMPVCLSSRMVLESCWLPCSYKILLPQAQKRCRGDQPRPRYWWTWILSLPFPASWLLVAYPKPVLLLFGHSLGYKILFSVFQPPFGCFINY